MKKEDLFNKIHYNLKELGKRKFPDDFVNNLICGDCIEVMDYMPNDCIDLVITSPPYFLGKSYEKDFTWESYQELLKGLFYQVNRILKPGKYFVINFGDYFNSKNRFYKSDVPSVYPATVQMWERGFEAGFDLQATRIWRKQFGRMSIPFVCNSHPRNIFDYEHIWTFRKRNGSNEEFVNNRKLSQRGVVGEDWTSSARLSDHEAAFPLELPKYFMLIYSGKGDIVLDPFAGILTTVKASLDLDRKFIGIEKNKQYCNWGFKNL